MPSDQITISAGSVPDQIVVVDDGCQLTYDLTGPVAGSPLGGACNGQVVENTIEAMADGLLHLQGVTGTQVQDQLCTVTTDGYLSRQ